MAQLAPLQAKAEKLVGSIDSVFSVVTLMLNPKARENINASFESVRKSILSIEQTAYKMDDLIDVEKPKISGILNKVSTRSKSSGTPEDFARRHPRSIHFL